MPVTKKSDYQALVNLSVGHVIRNANGREEWADRVAPGETVELTEQEAAAFGRFVRPVEKASEPMKRFTAKDVAGARTSPVNLEGSGAIDITDKTELLTPAQSEEARVAAEDAAIVPE